METMEKNYRYHLLKYKGRNSRYRCPACGRPRCFTPYVDENDVPADVERYGRCDHVRSCGYNLYPPYEPNRRGGMVYALPKFRKRPEKNRKEIETKLDTLPLEIVGKTLLFTPKNGFISFLSGQFGEETAKALVKKYRIGTTRDGFTVFYQYDIMDRCRTGKIIPYDPHTGHRIKDGSVPEAMWVHSRLKAMHQLPDDWTLSQCLFGEHLLSRYPDLPVALVEAEKTAVICSAVFPEFLWLATGGLSQFNDRVNVLLGRKVIAIPDLGAYDLWRKKAREYPLLDITVSDYLEKNATPELREMGADLADWVVVERTREGVEALLENPAPAHHKIILEL